jgi:hypothetical protein
MLRVEIGRAAQQDTGVHPTRPCIGPQSQVIIGEGLHWGEQPRWRENTVRAERS